MVIVITAVFTLILGNAVILGNFVLSQQLGYITFVLTLIAFLLSLIIYRFTKLGITEQPLQNNERNKVSSYEFFAVNTAASILLIILAERSFVFSNSIISFFPPNILELQASLSPFSLLYGFTGNGQGFIVQSLFINLEYFLPLTVPQFDKIALLTELFFYYFLAAAVSRTMYRVIEIRSIRESIFSVMFASFFLFNFIYYSAGYGSFIIGPLMIGYSTLKIYEAIKTENFRRLDAFQIGFAISFSVFGDPRTLVYFVLILLGIAVGLILTNRRMLLGFAKFSSATFLIVLPMFAIMYIMTSFTTGFVANAGRVGDFGTIAFFSSATQPMFIWDFLANWWSGFVSAPPSIIYVQHSIVNSLPTLYAGNAILVYVPSSENVIWTFSLGILSVFAILSLLLYKKDYKNSNLVLLYFPFFIIFALTLGTNLDFRPFVELVAFLSTIPIVGSLWAVTVSTPQWIDQYISSFLIIFASYSILRITQVLDESPSHQKHIGFRFNLNKLRTYKKYILVFAVLFLFLFANWQIFVQNYALGQELPNNLTGNQVSSTPPIVPVNPPAGWLNAYNSLYDPNNLSYAVYTNDGGLIPLTWDNGSNSFTMPGIQPNPTFYNVLNQIIKHNMSYLIPSLMYNFGVKYVFFDKSQLHPNWNLYHAFVTSGIVVLSNTNNFTIFEDKNASEIEPSNFSISCNASALGDVQLLNLFNSNQMFPILTGNNNSSIAFTNQYNNLRYREGLFYSSSKLSTVLPALKIGSFNGTYSGSSNSASFSIGNEWNITRFNGAYYVNYIVNNGVLKVQKYDNGTENSPNSVFNIYYKNSSIPIPKGDSVNLNYNFTYSTSHSNGTIGFYMQGENYTNNIQNYRDIQIGTTNNTVNGTFSLSPGQTTFGFGWALNKYNGLFVLRNLNISYSFLKNGMTYANSLSQSFSAIPNTNYTVIYFAANNSLHIHTMTQYFKSYPNSTLKITISGFKYISSIVVFPTQFASNTLIRILDLKATNYGSYIEGTVNYSHAYVSLSYNSVYKWSISKNIKLIGINSLGQEIFSLTSPGKITFSIRGWEYHNIVDWTTVIIEDMILPLFLFTETGSYIKFLIMSKRDKEVWSFGKKP